MEKDASSTAEEAAPAAVEAPEVVLSEKRKLFVGGVPKDTWEAEVRDHFVRYGEVKEVAVMRDRASGHGRGFAFVEFAEAAAAGRALAAKEHFIRGKMVDVKRAREKFGRDQASQSSNPQYSNQSQYNGDSDGNNMDDNNNNIGYGDSKKIFVGGLRDTITEEEFRGYFETFGTITDAVLMYDSTTHKSRGFGFITFESEEAVQKVMQNSFHELSGRTVEVKIAIPKNDRNYHNGRNRGSRAFGKGHASYEDSMYPQYHKYGLYPGYMLPTLSPYPYYGGGYVAGYPVAGYGASGYGNTYPNQRVAWNYPATAARWGPMPYAIYPGYVNGWYGASYMGVNGTDCGVDGVSDGNRNQTSVDLQTVEVSTTITTKLENVKLDTQ